MPIDDALEDIDDGKGKKQRRQKNINIKIDMAEIISKHIDKVNELIYETEEEIDEEIGTDEESEKTEGEEMRLDKDQILTFAKWIKFTYGCKLDIMPIPRKEMLGLLSEQDSDFKELLEVSDMSKYLDDPVNITNRDAYSKISEFTDISKIIDFEQIKSFLAWGAKVIISDLDYLSLFIKEGETLRRYAEITGKAPKKKYIIDVEEGGLLLLDTEFKPFDSKTLAQFCKKTGINEVHEMVRETTDLLEFFRQNYSEDKTSMDKEYVSKVRNELFDRLRKYHPDLVCEENTASRVEQLPPDYEDFDELPEPPEEEAPEPPEDDGDEPYPKGFPADPKSNPPYEF